MISIPELREPGIEGLVDGSLDPDQMPAGAHVSVFYDGMRQGDQVQLHWSTSVAAGSYTQTGAVLADSTPLPFTVPYEALDAGRGLDAVVYYASVRDGVTRESYRRIIPIRDQGRPVITGVQGNRGEIPEGGSTLSPYIRVSGTAQAPDYAEVEVFDGTVLHETSWVRDGAWQVTFVDLPVGGHHLTATALYGNGLVSRPRTFTTLKELRPIITDVSDTLGTVPSGGSTTQTRLTLRGTATPGLQVEISDYPTQLQVVDIDENGRWECVLENLPLKYYSFHAAALYGAQMWSLEWHVAVVAP